MRLERGDNKMVKWIGDYPPPPDDLLPKLEEQDYLPMPKVKPYKGTIEEQLEEARLLRPFPCPICGGKGTVPEGFYQHDHRGSTSTISMPETCRSCMSGIVWG